MHDGKFFSTIKVKCKVSRVRNLSNMISRQIDMLRLGQQAPIGSTDANKSFFYYEPFGPTAGRKRFGVFKSSDRHVTPKLGILTE